MSKPRRIRVLSVDDHPLLHEGLATVLRTQLDMLLVGEASSGREAIQCFRECRPDITLNFHPATAGGKNASFSMVDSAPGSPHVIALTGAGVNSPTGVMVIIGGISLEGGITIQ